MAEIQDKSFADPQRERLATIVTEHAPSLPVGERESLLQHLEDFTASLAGQTTSLTQTWIPVTNRYPAPGEKVLIFIPRWGTLTIGSLLKNDPRRWELITMPGKSTDLVSHWYPLPAGPLSRP